jgi:glyoxylase-like metal-dependent hydrolase (beta-lactamase superfamily II)
VQFWKTVRRSASAVISSPAPAKPIRYIVNTSADADHTGGNEKLSKAGKTILGNNGSAEFQIWADGKLLYRSGAVTGATQARQVRVNVQGKQELWLVVNNMGSTTRWNHADWALAYLREAA